MDKAVQVTKETIEQAQAGDRDAFETIYDAYYERLARYALRRVLDQATAEDIAANVWLKIVKNLGSFTWRHEHSFTGWMFRIANNEVHQYFRKGAKYKTVAIDDEEIVRNADASAEQHAAFEASLDKEIQYMALHKCIAQLNKRHQDIIHLHYFENLSHKEIAIALNMRDGAVRTNASRAIKSLRSIVDKQPEFAGMEI